jgi:hypothetical protein
MQTAPVYLSTIQTSIQPSGLEFEPQTLQRYGIASFVNNGFPGIVSGATTTWLWRSILRYSSGLM